MHNSLGAGVQDEGISQFDIATRGFGEGHVAPHARRHIDKVAGAARRLMSGWIANSNTDTSSKLTW